MAASASKPGTPRTLSRKPPHIIVAPGPPRTAGTSTTVRGSRFPPTSGTRAGTTSPPAPDRPEAEQRERLGQQAQPETYGTEVHRLPIEPVPEPMSNPKANGSRHEALGEQDERDQTSDALGPAGARGGRYRWPGDGGREAGRPRSLSCPHAPAPGARTRHPRAGPPPPHGGAPGTDRRTRGWFEEVGAVRRRATGGTCMRATGRNPVPRRDVAGTAAAGDGSRGPTASGRQWSRNLHHRTGSHRPPRSSSSGTMRRPPPHPGRAHGAGLPVCRADLPSGPMHGQRAQSSRRARTASSTRLP